MESHEKAILDQEQKNIDNKAYHAELMDGLEDEYILQFKEYENCGLLRDDILTAFQSALKHHYGLDFDIKEGIEVKQRLENFNNETNEANKIVNQTDSLMDVIYKFSPPEKVSNCCGARLLPESNICSLCKEHAEIVPYDEWYGVEDETPLTQPASEFKNITYNGERIK